MASKVAICNFALSELGAARISDLTESTVSAQECNARYDIVADMVMSMGPWSSVKTRATLSQLSDAPDFGFTYQYQLPVSPKCLRVLSINEDVFGETDYQIEGDKLLTDATSAEIVYLGRLTNTESYDTYLQQAIIWQLVASMAYKFTGQSTVSEKLIARAEAKIKDLLNQNSVQGSGSDLPSNTFTDIRL